MNGAHTTGVLYTLEAEILDFVAVYKNAHGKRPHTPQAWDSGVPEALLVSTPGDVLNESNTAPGESENHTTNNTTDTVRVCLDLLRGETCLLL